MNIIFTLMMGLAFITSPAEGKVTSDVAFCNFELPRNIKVANATFTVVYSFEVDEEGRPIKITKVKDDHVGEAKVASCLGGWRFPGTKKGALLAVVFQWQHGDGWTGMSITGTDFSQNIRISGERCPYLRMKPKRRQTPQHH